MFLGQDFLFDKSDLSLSVTMVVNCWERGNYIPNNTANLFDFSFLYYYIYRVNKKIFNVKKIRKI